MEFIKNFDCYDSTLSKGVAMLAHQRTRGLDMSDLLYREPDIREVALAVRKWAVDNNLLRLGGGIDSSPRVERLEGAIAVSDEGMDILEKQKVTAIGFNR